MVVNVVVSFGFCIGELVDVDLGKNFVVCLGVRVCLVVEFFVDL